MEEKELAVRCHVYLTMKDGETQDEAIDRVFKNIWDTELDIQIYETEVREV